jgi:hypothetical protein
VIQILPNKSDSEGKVDREGLIRERHRDACTGRIGIYADLHLDSNSASVDPEHDQLPGSPPSKSTEPRLVGRFGAGIAGFRSLIRGLHFMLRACSFFRAMNARPFSGKRKVR